MQWLQSMLIGFCPIDTAIFYHFFLIKQHGLCSIYAVFVSEKYFLVLNSLCDCSLVSELANRLPRYNSLKECSEVF